MVREAKSGSDYGLKHPNPVTPFAKQSIARKATAMTLVEVKQHFRTMMNGPLAQSMREKGLAYRVIFGVEWPRLMELAQEVGKDHQLAQSLWKEDIRECRLLAGLVQPVESFYPEIADIWVESMHYPEEAQYTVLSLFQHLPYASQKAFEWVAAADEMHQLCGYLLLARLFMQGNPLMRQSEVEYMDQASAALGSRSLAVRKAAYDSLMKYSLIGAEQEALVNKVMCSLESAAN